MLFRQIRKIVILYKTFAKQNFQINKRIMPKFYTDT